MITWFCSYLYLIWGLWAIQIYEQSDMKPSPLKNHRWGLLGNPWGPEMDSPWCQLYQHLLGITPIPIYSLSLCTTSLDILKLCWTALSFTFWSRPDQTANRQLCFDDSRGGGSAKDPGASDRPLGGNINNCCLWWCKMRTYIFLSVSFPGAFKSSHVVTLL